MQEERLAILEHPVVSGISDVLLSGGQRHGFRVSLRCQTAQQNGHGVCDCGGLRQGVPVRVSKTRATLLACLQDLHNQVLRQHGPNCIAACKALAAQRMSQDDSSAGAPDAFRLMMDLNKAKKTLDKAVAELKTMKERADKVNKQALELQKLVEGAEKEVILLQAQLHPKRARIDADAEEEDEIENVGDWTLADHRREASRVQNRRNEKLGSRQESSNYRTGSLGYLQHPRLGLMGWVSYWSRGHVGSAVHMIVQLIRQLGLSEEVINGLPATEGMKEKETNAHIVDRFKEALHELKRCRNEQQRIEYHIALGLVMPPRDSGLISRVCERLGVPRSKRSKQRDAGRRFASDQAVDRRAEFNKDIKAQTGALTVGDKVCLCVCI